MSATLVKIIETPAVSALLRAIETIGGGELAREAAKGLQECVKATHIQDKASALTLTLNVTKTSDEAVAIAGSVGVRTPKPKPKSSFFVDTMQYLPVRERPETQSLPFMS